MREVATVSELALRYDTSLSAIRRAAKCAGFPAGAGVPVEYPVREVDAWVRANRPWPAPCYTGALQV